jgi:nicotinamidase-related amidase
MLSIDNTALLVIDVQGKLAQIMDQKETLFANLERMIKGAQVLELPILWAEQVPEKLGPTQPEIATLLSETSQPIAKSSFSCCGAAPFMTALKATDRRQILVTGIETHVCVYQTTLDLLSLAYEVQLVVDATSSRTPENKAIALERMKTAGATLTSTEMALFELLRVAEGNKFRAISRLVK